MNLGIQKILFLQGLSRIIGTDESKTLKGGKRKKGKLRKGFLQNKETFKFFLKLLLY